MQMLFGVLSLLIPSRVTEVLSLLIPSRVTASTAVDMHHCGGPLLRCSQAVIKKVVVEYWSLQVAGELDDVERCCLQRALELFDTNQVSGKPDGCQSRSVRGGWACITPIGIVNQLGKWLGVKYVLLKRLSA